MRRFFPWLLTLPFVQALALPMKISPCSPRRSAPFRWGGAVALRVLLIRLAACCLIPAAPGRAESPAKVPTYTLDDCLALARKQNPDVLVAAKRVDAARANITTARAQVYPQVTTSGYYQYREQSLSSEGGVAADTRKDDYYGTARVTQNVFSSGQVRNRIATAKLQADAENKTYLAQVDASLLATRLAFYQTLYAEASVDIRKQAVDLLTAQLKDQTDRLAAGSVGQLNVNRAQVSLANEQPSLQDAQSSVQTAYVALSALLGVAYPEDGRTQPFRVHGELSCPPMRLTLAECLAKAQAQRPEVVARKLAVDALRHQIVADKAGTRPQVSAFASYDIYSEPSLLSVRDNFSGYTIGVQATWNVFDGFATRGRVRSDQAQQGQAEAQLEAIRQQVDADVRTAFYALQDAANSLKPLGENIARATEGIGLSINNFDTGGATQLDVLQSRILLTNSRLTELAVRLSYHNALARLERAMGLGRPTEGSTTALPKTNK